MKALDLFIIMVAVLLPVGVMIFYWVHLEFKKNKKAREEVFKKLRDEDKKK